VGHGDTDAVGAGVGVATGVAVGVAVGCAVGVGFGPFGVCAGFFAGASATAPPCGAVAAALDDGVLLTSALLAGALANNPNGWGCPIKNQTRASITKKPRMRGML
jgi:hypothetical protein